MTKEMKNCTFYPNGQKKKLKNKAKNKLESIISNRIDSLTKNEKYQPRRALKGKNSSSKDILSYKAKRMEKYGASPASYYDELGRNLNSKTESLLRSSRLSLQNMPLFVDTEEVNLRNTGRSTSRSQRNSSIRKSTRIDSNRARIRKSGSVHDVFARTLRGNSSDSKKFRPK
jgi:hypothetical protein